MRQDNWISDRAFIPEIGKFYEINFGEVTYKGQFGPWTALIRVEGISSSHWIDVDTQFPLDSALAHYVVKGYRELHVATWVVIHDPDRSPSPFAAYRYENGRAFGYALDGVNYEIVRQQLPPDGVVRDRAEADHKTVREFWDYFTVSA